MPNNFPADELEPLPDTAQRAFDSYPFPRASDQFNARFWHELDARQGRYRGWRGVFRRLVEVEIEGVAVWRLAASTFSGGAFCLLAVGVALHVATPKTIAPVPALPFPDPLPPTPMYAFAWSRRALESGVWPDEKPLAPRQRATSKPKDFSCTPLNAPWA